MKAIGISLLVVIAGYAIGVLLGIVAVNLFSTNQHDNTMEAVMTGFFFVGPVLAVLSLIGFWVIRALR
jgi:hypothetical protein